MASGRSGQLVVTGAKDPLTSSRAQHVRRRSSATDPAYFLQRRFEDTAYVIFQQHVERLKEVSPGYYSPLRSDNPAPSIHVLPGIGPAGGPALGSNRDRAGLGSDKASTGSGGSVPRSGASPVSGSSGARTPLRNDSESSADRTQEKSRGVVVVEENGAEENGVPPDHVFAESEFTSPAEDAAAASLSDSSSVASSEPDSDLDEGSHLAGATVESSVKTSVEVAEGHHVGEKSVDNDREGFLKHGEHRAEGAPLNGQGESVNTVQLESQGINNTPHSRLEPSSPKEPFRVNEPSSFSEPPSPRELSQVNESTSFSEPPSPREPQTAAEPLPVPSSGNIDDPSANSDEEVQITRL